MVSERTPSQPDSNATAAKIDAPSKNRSPFFQLLLARFREFCREPAAVFWVYVFPLLMMIALGLAFRNQPVESFQLMVIDQAKETTTDQANSDEAVNRVQAIADYLQKDERLKVVVADEIECRRRLRVGKTDLLVAIEHDKEIESYEYFYDATRPGSLLARNIADDLLQRNAGRTDVFEPTDHSVAEPGGRYIDFLIPGLLGIGIMGGGLFGLGYAIVDMRLRKLLKRYMATPMRKTDFLAAVMTSRMIFTIPEIIFLLIVSRLLFGVVVHGNYVSLGILIIIGTLQFSGIGLLVASRARTLESASGLINLTVLPMWMLSGIFFSYERFPEVLHPIIRVLPLTPLVDSLRAVMLEGESLLAQSTEIGIMVAWGVITFFLALIWFRWS